MTEILKVQFDEICKGTILPFFKELGFKRKTLHFAKQTNDITQCFNVQKSQWNSYHDNVMFTFNFGFYNADISSILADKEVVNEFPKTYDCFIQNRLGTISHNRDHWYTLSKNIDVKKTAEQIRNDLEKYLKPMFDNYVSLDNLKQLIDKDEKYISPTLSPYYFIGFYMLTDQKEKGRKTIVEHYQNSLKPQTVTDTIVFPDGTRQEKVKTYINQHYIDSIKKLADRYEVKL
jgi:predicted DNA-binding protein